MDPGSTGRGARLTLQVCKNLAALAAVAVAAGRGAGYYRDPLEPQELRTRHAHRTYASKALIDIFVRYGLLAIVRQPCGFSKTHKNPL